MNVVIAVQIAFNSNPSTLNVCNSDWVTCLINYRDYISANRASIASSSGEDGIDAALYFKHLTGFGDVGRAYINTLCHPGGYNTGISGQIFEKPWYLNARIVAHELGHLCNMQHTRSGSDDRTIMGYDSFDHNVQSNWWSDLSREDINEYMEVSYGKSGIFPRCLEDHATGVPQPTPRPRPTPRPTPQPVFYPTDCEIRRVDGAGTNGYDSSTCSNLPDAGMPNVLSSADPGSDLAGTRCCSMDGTSANSFCNAACEIVSFADAKERCTDNNMRLCTENEILSGLAAGTGCE